MSGGHSAIAPSLIFNENSFTVKLSDNETQAGCVTTGKAVDLSSKNTLKCKVSSVSATSSMSNGCFLFIASALSSTLSFVKSVTLNVGDNEIDISDISGSYYVGIYLANQTVANRAVTISEIWAE